MSTPVIIVLAALAALLLFLCLALLWDFVRDDP